MDVPGSNLLANIMWMLSIQSTQDFINHIIRKLMLCHQFRMLLLQLFSQQEGADPILCNKTKVDAQSVK